MVHGVNCNQEFAHLLDQQPAMQNQYHTVSFRLFSGCVLKKTFFGFTISFFQGQGVEGCELVERLN